MARVVLVGGFSNGERSLERVAEALEDHFEEIDFFTFPEAMASPLKVARAVKNVSVLTHSAGIMAVPFEEPKEFTAYGAPFPKSRTALIGSTALKTLQMFARNPVAAARFTADSGKELSPFGNDPKGHWTPFLRGNISRFDSIQLAIMGRNWSRQEPAKLVYGSDDLYYPLSSYINIEFLDKAGDYRGFDLEIIPGFVHDELILDPKNALIKILN